MSRIHDRQGFDEGTRIQLLESDMDKDDEDKESIRQELHGLRNVLVGILISAATASILLAVNIVVQQAG